MTRKESIEKLKSLVTQIFSKEVVEVKMSQYETNDGKQIVSDAETLDINAMVYGLDSEGNQVPLDNGDYSLNDGKIITVVDGVITAIKNAEEAPVEEAPTEEMAVETVEEVPVEETPAEEETEKLSVEDLQAQIDELRTIIESLVEGNGQLMENSKVLMSRVEKMSSVPVEGFREIKTTFNQFTSADSKKVVSNQKLEEMRELRKIMKNK